ncbi:MAG TPA: metallophosphoesterase [Mycobacteriales bacterium]|nr:metallophosphoesterase [Mycobacteriales bacterium]
MTTVSPARRLGGAAAVVVLALAGAFLAVTAFGALSRPVGPFDVRLSLRPVLDGRTVLAVPPLGDVGFDTHDGPVALEVRVTGVRPAAAAALVGPDADLQQVGQDAREQLRRAVLLLLLRDGLLAVGGAGLAALLVLRAGRPALIAAGTATVVLAATGAVVGATASSRGLDEPEYSGALTYAPSVIGDVQDVLARLDDYGQQLGRLVTNVATLYDAASTLPSYAAQPGTVRLLHVSDLHLSTSAYPLIASVVAQFDVDLVVDTGDVADHGSSVEDAYVDAIAGLRVPYLYVRGNHDSVGTEAAVRRQPNAVVLDDGFPVRVAGLTVMGQADPRFTPDKQTGDEDAPREELLAVGRHLRDVVLTQQPGPDVVAVHDPVSAEPLAGEVPLVLAGHTHRREVTEQDGTRLMVQGSTGGAGLRALEGETPTPVQLTVLYLDGSDGRLQAYDEISLGGLGLSDARIRRQVVAEPAAGSPSPAG